MIKYVDTFVRPDLTIPFYQMTDLEYTTFLVYTSQLLVDYISLDDKTLEIITRFVDQAAVDKVSADPVVIGFKENRQAYNALHNITVTSVVP